MMLYAHSLNHVCACVWMWYEVAVKIRSIVYYACNNSRQIRKKAHIKATLWSIYRHSVVRNGSIEGSENCLNTLFFFLFNTFWIRLERICWFCEWTQRVEIPQENIEISKDRRFTACLLSVCEWFCCFLSSFSCSLNLDEIFPYFLSTWHHRLLGQQNVYSYFRLKSFYRITNYNLV